MKRSAFIVAGHFNPFGKYPAPVIPVGDIGGGKLVALPDDSRVVVEPDVSTLWVRHSPEVTDSLHPFDPELERMFAVDPSHVRKYQVAREHAFFAALLADRTFSADNVFLRLPLARGADNQSFVTQELERAVTFLCRTAPNLLSAWYAAQHRSFQQRGIAIPAQWPTILRLEPAGLIGLRIVGELSSVEDLVVNSLVEGVIRLPTGTLTVGIIGHVKASVHAKSVIVFGQVTGNVTATEKVEIRDSGFVDCDITAPRVAIAEGATFRGSIDTGRRYQAKERLPHHVPSAR